MAERTFMNDVMSPLDWREGTLFLLDQRRLPLEEVWIPYRDHEAVATAIRTMVVRGAPAIGCVAAFGVVLGVRAGKSLDEVIAVLAATRPTAVNLFWALTRMRSAAAEGRDLESEALALWHDDIER